MIVQLPLWADGHSYVGINPAMVQNVEDTGEVPHACKVYLSDARYYKVEGTLAQVIEKLNGANNSGN
jgi:hypothetical protein